MKDKFGIEIGVGDKIRYGIDVEGIAVAIFHSSPSSVRIYGIEGIVTIKNPILSNIEVIYKASYEKLSRWQYMDIVRIDDGKLYLRNKFFDSDTLMWQGLATGSPHTIVGKDEADQWVEERNPVLIVRNGKSV